MECIGIKSVPFAVIPSVRLNLSPFGPSLVTWSPILLHRIRSVESVTLRLPVIVTSSVVAESIGAEIVMAIADDEAPGSLKSFESSFFGSPP